MKFFIRWPESKKKNVSLLINKREFRSKISVVYKFVIESFVRFIGTIGIRKQCMSCFASRSCFRSWRGSVWSLFSFFSFYLQSSTLLNKFWFSFFGISQSTHSSSKCILDASICLVSFLSFPPSFRQFFRNKCLSKLYRFKLDNRFRHG